MVYKKLLAEGGRDGRYRRMHRLKKPYHRPNKIIIGELNSSNYMLQDAIANSRDEIWKYREEYRSRRSPIGRSRERRKFGRLGIAGAERRPCNMPWGGGPDSPIEEENRRYGNCSGGNRTRGEVMSGGEKLRTEE